MPSHLSRHTVSSDLSHLFSCLSSAYDLFCYDKACAILFRHIHTHFHGSINALNGFVRLTSQERVDCLVEIRTFLDGTALHVEIGSGC